MLKKTAIITGSFDPVTNGHINLIKRSLAVFDTVIAAISTNSEKKHLLSLNDRLACVKEAVSGLGNVTAVKYDGLLADFVLKNNGILVKGARNSTDFDYEAHLYQVNNALTGVDTIIFPADPKLGYISSSFVRELIKYNHPIDAYAPECVKKYVVLPL